MQLFYLSDGKERLRGKYFKKGQEPKCSASDREALFWGSENEGWVQQLPKSKEYKLLKD